MTEYFKDDGWVEQSSKQADDFINTVNINGTYKPQTLEGCLNDLKYPQINKVPLKEKDIKRNKY